MTVISAVQGGPDTIIDGQGRLLGACRETGVERLVPSDLAESLFSIPDGINPYLDARRAFAGIVGRSGVGYTHLLNGGFMGVILAGPGLIDTQARTIAFWGDGHVPLDFTAIDDVADHLVAVIDDPATLNATVEVAGDWRTVHEIADDDEVVTGRTLKRNCRGSIEDAYATPRRMDGEGGDAMTLVPLQYLLQMMYGEGRLRDVRNARYPHIKPMSLRTFVGAHRASTPGREAI